MPRFDREGFNPNKRIDNDSRDRSVPVDENYYADGEFSFNQYNASNTDDVIDRQYNVDLNEYINSFEAPSRDSRQSADSFVPEVMYDADAQRREDNERNARARRDSGSHRQRRKRPRRNRSPLGKLLLAIIAIIVIIALLASLMLNGVLGKITYDDKRDNQYVASSELKDEPIIKNILLIGVDARPDDEKTASRSDSMMIVSVDMKHRCIKTVSFLRDTWVYIPAHDGSQRLNAACTYDGYNGVMDTIEYNFGVDIDGYVVTDFEMFKVLVDGVGGVDVDVTEKEANEVTNHKKRYGGVTLEAGEHKLTGEQALAYCRIRKIDTDFVRTKRQRTVIKSIISGVKHTGPLSLFKMAMNAAPYIETDLTKSELKRIALAAGLCMSGDMVEERVPFDKTWEYATINGASVISINVDKNKEKLIDFIYKKSASEIQAEQAED